MASSALPAPRHLRLVSGSQAASGSARTAAGTRTGAGRRATIVLLVGSTIALTGVGLIMVLSASSVSAYAEYGSSFLFFRRQAIYAVVGMAALVVISRIDYRAWQRLSVPLTALSVVLLALVLHPAAGTVAGGSARWITVGPVTIQPSELAKLALVTFGAAVLARKWNRLDQLAHLALPLLPVLAVVCALIIVQPDLGTTVIVAGIVFLLMFVAGVRLRYLLGAGLLTCLLGMGLILSEGYRRARFLSFLHPWGDPQNSGYQVIQSLLALGSGGWFGVGLGASRQKWLYVPNAHTDFIFSILGEELGLAGALLVLLLFGALLYAGIRVAVSARDVFGRLLAAGIVGWLGLQALVNLGAVTGLLPVTGVPLPLVSFGGSSLVVTLAAVGILLSIARSGPPPVRAGRTRSRRARR